MFSSLFEAHASQKPVMYLDHNATTPLDPRVAKRMRPYLAEQFGNPASREHAYGWDAAEAVELAREQVAELIHASPAEIIFTSGTTEGINQGLKGIATRGCTLITAATEHNAVLEVARQLQRTHDADVRILGADHLGYVDFTAFAAAFRAPSSCLAAFSMANAETGVVHPVGPMIQRAHQAGAICFVDLAQAVGKIPVDVRELDFDIAAFSAHKMYGPKGVGALFMRGGENAVKIEPLIAGGGQERGLRGGTLNVPGIVGFGEACRIAREELAEDAARVSTLRDHLEASLLRLIPDVTVNGDPESRLPNTSNLCFAGIEARALIRDLHTIALSTQSACSSGSTRPSHVLTAMGLTDDAAYSSVRFSLGRFTTPDEIDATIAKVTASVNRLRSAS